VQYLVPALLSTTLVAKAESYMTDWMNFGLMLLTFGLGLGFVAALEHMK
jgi:hypothetical protein